jgi:hypothetical protein
MEEIYIYTGCRGGPLWFDVRDPVRDEATHDLFLSFGFVQKFIVVHVALRDAFLARSTADPAAEREGGEQREG